MERILQRGGGWIIFTFQFDMIIPKIVGYLLPKNIRNKAICVQNKNNVCSGIFKKILVHNSQI